jgi:DNA modification methylase
MDVAITSPPYINALDYVRCIKIESAWIDTGDDTLFSDLRHKHVGDSSRALRQVDSIVDSSVHKIVRSIEKVDPRRASTVLGYFQDMLCNLNCVFDVLRPGGQYHIIVGDSVIRGVSVPTHRLLAEIGESIGFEWTAYYYYRIKDHRTSIPRNGQGGKIDIEHVISLQKPTHRKRLS